MELSKINFHLLFLLKNFTNELYAKNFRKGKK